MLHTQENKKKITNVYPVEQQFASIKTNETVAIAGFGLTSMDIVASLTLGRGGRYERDVHNGDLNYIPSGEEPFIVMFSRTGLPYLARPLFDVHQHYEASFFTKENIDALRNEALRKRGNHQLDLEKDVLPLLWDEMKLRYYTTVAHTIKGQDAANQLKHDVREARNQGRLHECIQSLIPHYGEFNLEEKLAFSWSDMFHNAEEYQRKFCELLINDLAEAKKGVPNSPVKAAFELFRDLRNTIRYAVDFGGLDPKSHTLFMKKYIPLMNRIVTGPQKERLEEILALIKAGLVKVPFGPAPKVSFDEKENMFHIQTTFIREFFTVKADYLCGAFIDQPSVENSSELLLQNLYNQGRIQPFYNGDSYIGGVHLNTNLQPINKSGHTEENIWILGPLSEGIKYYNHYVPSPMSSSPAIIDADYCVSQLFERYLSPLNIK